MPLTVRAAPAVSPHTAGSQDCFSPWPPRSADSHNWPSTALAGPSPHSGADPSPLYALPRHQRRQPPADQPCALRQLLPRGPVHPRQGCAQPPAVGPGTQPARSAHSAPRASPARRHPPPAQAEEISASSLCAALPPRWRSWRRTTAAKLSGSLRNRASRATPPSPAKPVQGSSQTPQARVGALAGDRGQGGLQNNREAPPRCHPQTPRRTA